MKIKIKLEDGKVIERKPRFTQMGNFVVATVRYQNEEYFLNEWDGDEYLRGVDDEQVYTLKPMSKE